MARALLIGQGTLLTAAVLKGWLEAGHEVAEIWTTPRERLSRSQRTMQHWAPDWSVYRLAKRQGIAMFENPPLRRWDGYAARIAALKVDTLITAVTMQIMPQAVLDLFGPRAVNFHPALLPHYRGPSPYLGTLLDGKENMCAGVTLHVLSAGIDEGDIIAQRAVRFDDVGRDYQRWIVAHAVAAGALARDDLPRYFAGDLQAVPQGEGSYRRVADETIVSGRLSLAELQTMLTRIGTSGRVTAKIGTRTVRVSGLAKALGAPTGAAPSVTPWNVTMDLADSRVALVRRTVLDDGREKLHLLGILREVDRAAE